MPGTAELRASSDAGHLCTSDQVEYGSWETNGLRKNASNSGMSLKRSALLGGGSGAGERDGQVHIVQPAGGVVMPALQAGLLRHPCQIQAQHGAGRRPQGPLQVQEVRVSCFSQHCSLSIHCCCFSMEVSRSLVLLLGNGIVLDQNCRFFCKFQALQCCAG